jgi:hypothetical protein
MFCGLGVFVGINHPVNGEICVVTPAIALAWAIKFELQVSIVWTDGIHWTDANVVTVPFLFLEGSAPTNNRYNSRATQHGRQQARFNIARPKQFKFQTVDAGGSRLTGGGHVPAYS